MSLIERYLFRQMLIPTLLAAAALFGVGLLSQSLGQLDIIIDQRQSALVFLKIIMLAMPQLANLILPISVLVAALVALNRLHTEQELVVCFAGGMSRWRLISPAMHLAILAVLVGLVVNLWIQPAAYREMRRTLYAAKTDLAATLVVEGQFTEPAPHFTVYGQTVDPDGLIHNLFIHQETATGGATTYTAKEGRIVYRDKFPILVMRQGSNQEFSDTGVLNFLSFEEYALDLRPFLNADGPIRYKSSDRYLHELFYPDLRQSFEKKNRTKLLAEGHSRLASPLYSLAFMAMALAAVVAAGFSRLGYGRRIAAIGAAAAAVRILGFAVQAACDDNVWMNALQYLIPLAATAWGFGQVFRSVERRSGWRDWMPFEMKEPKATIGAPA
ncbi:lipopolysaccharide export system permease protein [Caulobacter ginsengisoli]|uniref:Lipopolysaccharide export system permease protein n=1 Tax=Caulobacter ginsengisoli TaxID=400775 RepID=A0ABU0IPY2_9CAUL|nr:LPS export ABC transporter permease LptF [Caulobacter ginsengisoli]MDQ0464065.1 lipopolysaccharide export system permease protein [Caulobacter ginsengisoli]